MSKKYDHITKKILEDLYLNQKLPLKECAKILNVSIALIYKRRKEYCIKSRNQPSIEVKCAYCGKKFFTRISGLKIGRGKYCSRKCSSAGQKKQIERTCEMCGKIFFVKHAIVKLGKGKYCSKKCHDNSKLKKIKSICQYCGKEFYTIPTYIKSGGGKYCSQDCYHKNNIAENNYRWCGGGKYALYDTYAKQIYPIENVRRSPNNKEILQTKCAYCGKWFEPKREQVAKRVASIKGQLSSECRLYCSDGCKKSCPIFNQNKWPKGFKKATSREVQPELRQLRLKIDNYQCQICGKTIDETGLHCHHITGIVQNPIESADLDNTITLCKFHHKEVHKLPGCHYHELRCNNNQEDKEIEVA